MYWSCLFSLKNIQYLNYYIKFFCLFSTQAVTGYVGENAFNYYHVNSFSTNSLLIWMNQTSATGDCDLYVKVSCESYIMHAYTSTRTHAHIHASTQAHKHMRTRTRIQAHARTHARIRTQHKHARIRTQHKHVQSFVFGIRSCHITLLPHQVSN